MLLTLRKNRNPQRHAHDPLPGRPRSSCTVVYLGETACSAHIRRGTIHLVPDPALSGQLVGRDHELSRLISCAADGDRRARPGRPHRGRAGHRQVRSGAGGLRGSGRPGCQVFWGAGDELGQALPLLPILDGLRVREPSANPRQETIVALLRGEVASGRGEDVPTALAEQLLALVDELCASVPTVLVVDDLQWADHASVTLWERLSRSARHLPLLLVGHDAPGAAAGGSAGPAAHSRPRRAPPSGRAPRRVRDRAGRDPGGRQARRRPDAARGRRRRQPALPYRAGGRAGPQLQPDRLRRREPRS